jgi:hypothetical protein
MQTLTQYEYLDRDFILKGVVDWLVKESPLLGALPMKSIQGNSYKYNVSTALPTASWTTVGEQLGESTGTFEQRSTDIYTLIQTAYTDKSKIAMNATQNPEAIDAALAAQAMAHEFEKTLIIGQTSVDSDSAQFKGLLRILAEFESSSTTDLDGQVYTAPDTGHNTQVLTAADTSGYMPMAAVDALVDQVRPGKPDLLLMSRYGRRRLNALQRASGSGVEMTESALFGKFMQSYDGIPIYVSDWIKDNYYNNSSSVLAIADYDFDTSRTTDYDNSVMFAMKLGENGVHGLHSGEMKHEREEFVEDYNAIANRYIWYVGLACTAKYSLAALVSFDPSLAS